MEHSGTVQFNLNYNNNTPRFAEKVTVWNGATPRGTTPHLAMQFLGSGITIIFTEWLKKVEEKKKRPKKVQHVVTSSFNHHYIGNINIQYI